MIEVNGQYVTSDISDIIAELKQQCELNGNRLFYKSIDTPKNYMVCCPFHKNGQERRPSMGILKSDGTCHCFACGWVGSIQELISNVFGYDDLGLYGSKWIIKNFLTLKVESRDDLELDFERNTQINTIKQQYVSEEELSSYRYTHPYMYERKLTDEIIDLFDIGYDRNSRSITFPVRDLFGNCLFVARRSVDKKFFNYPQGVEKPLYGLYELFKLNGKYSTLKNIHNRGGWRFSEIIVCESMLDALTCWVYGKYAVALNGLGNSLQFKQLRELPCRCLVIATDNDEAGYKARQRIKQQVTNKILMQYLFPENKKDINDLSEKEFNSLEKVFL